MSGFLEDFNWFLGKKKQGGEKRGEMPTSVQNAPAPDFVLL